MLPSLRGASIRTSRTMLDLSRDGFRANVEGEPDGDGEDPVCGMRIDSEEAAGTIEYGGKTYYFCSQACHDAFEADPTSYVT